MTSMHYRFDARIFLLNMVSYDSFGFVFVRLIPILTVVTF